MKYRVLLLLLSLVAACTVPEPIGSEQEALTDSFCGCGEVETGRVQGYDAASSTDLGDHLTLRPGRSWDADDSECWGNIFLDLGLGADNTNGEAAQLNFGYGDNRIATAPAYIGAEIGFLKLDGYDTDPVSGVERTPYTWRIHSGTNESTGKHIGVLLHAQRELNLESQYSYTQIEVPTIGERWQEGFHTSSGGIFEKHFAFKTTTSGASTSRITLPHELVPFGWIGDIECRMIAKELGGTRESYRFGWRWLGASSPYQAVVEDLKTIVAVPPYAPLAGRVAVFDLGGGGDVAVDVTGLASVNLVWSLKCDLVIDGP